MQGKTNDSVKKQCRSHNDQQSKNNKKTKNRRKNNVWIFQKTNEENLTREDLEMAKKCKESESLLIATQNNVIRINYIKSKID